ncbi:hypothetical protein [Schinkia azotoformans]|uniref:hypothetical protein n=1 Tax=Schinkia azotoformans TaxID=1454 RepID=UPI002DBAF442|nr:hypothetical protein [Schinkia azotoformans]MEC1744132.1 hypothetical protein [Schinkia azotoformans]
MMIVTTKEISEILGLSDRRIRQLADENALVKVGHGKFDLPQSIQKYIEYQVAKVAGDVDDDMNKLKEETLWTRARRKKSELEYKIMSGELHRSQDIEEVMNAMLSSFRAQLLAFPTKVSPKIVGQTEIMAVKELMKKEVYDLMTELSDYDPDVFYERSKDKIFLENDEVKRDAKD